MKLTVLVDNNTNDFSEPFLLGESGLSYLIEIDGTQILFDTGCGDVFLRNADALGIDLTHLDMLILSHGHEDHTWGIDSLIKRLGQEHTRQIKLIAHPHALMPKWFGEEQIAIRNDIHEFFSVQESVDPVWLTAQICFLGQIPRENSWEGKQAVGERMQDGVRVPDLVEDDTALVYKTADGLVIITGCSHAGVCNTIAYAKSVCADERILDVIGGFHLLQADQAVLQQTGDYLATCRPVVTHPCHCTDLSAKIFLSQHVPVEEVRSGLVLEFD